MSAFSCTLNTHYRIVSYILHCIWHFLTTMDINTHACMHGQWVSHLCPSVSVILFHCSALHQLQSALVKYQNSLLSVIRHPPSIVLLQLKLYNEYRPIIAVGLIVVTTSTSLSIGAWSLANVNFRDVSPPLGRSWTRQQHTLQHSYINTSSTVKQRHTLSNVHIVLVEC